MIAVGRRLALARDIAEADQSAVASVMGITQSAVSNYEIGDRMLPPEMAIRFCNRYGFTLEWLYRDDVSSLPTKLAEKVAARQNRVAAAE